MADAPQNLPVKVEAKPVDVYTGSRGVQFQNLDEMYRFSKALALSNLAPKDYKGSPETCLIAIQAGAEIGLPPMQAIQSIAVINGRPCLWGDTPLGLCMSSGYFDHAAFKEQTVGAKGTSKDWKDDYGWSCTAGRKGSSPHTSTFTVADAKLAKLWGKEGPWTFYPDRMLLCRARAFALRNTFPDVLRGIGIREEVEDYTPATVTQLPQTSAVERAANKAREIIEQEAAVEEPVAVG